MVEDMKPRQEVFLYTLFFGHHVIHYLTLIVGHAVAKVTQIDCGYGKVSKDLK
jgi:hypothetical protein